MPLHLSEIKGDNYFLIADKTANDTLKNLSLRLETAEENEDFLEEAKERLCDCIGYREAEKIGSYVKLRGVIKEEIAHRRPYNEFANLFWEEVIKAAKEVSDIDPEEEILRDAIYHTLRRTGLVKVYNIVKDTDLEELDIANSVLYGEDFNKILPLPKDTIWLLTKAMISSFERQKFLYALKQKGLSQEQIEKIDSSLYKSDSFDRVYKEVNKIADIPREIVYGFFTDKMDFNEKFKKISKIIECDLNSEQIENVRNFLKKLHKGLGKNQPFRIGKALMDLYSDNKNVKYVLAGCYRIECYYHLANFMRRADIKGYDVERVHTDLALFASKIISEYPSGHVSISGKLLRKLEKLTGLDPWQYATKYSAFTSEMKYLYPKIEISDDILGKLYGYLLSKGYRMLESWGYNGKKTMKDFLNVICNIGELNRKPSLFRPNEMGVPRQIINIFESVNPEVLGEVFAKSALRAYLENKGKVRKDRGGKRKKYHSWEVYVGLDHEDILRSLASKIGLSISEGGYCQMLWIERILQSFYSRQSSIQCFL